jgi:hypothetical protein
LLFSFACFAYAQSETDVTEYDLYTVWVTWHKAQYAMFEEFAHYEDTLQTKQNKEYEDKMTDLREVDEILFNQLQDNSVSVAYLLLDAAEAALIVAEIGDNSIQTLKMLKKEPVDVDCVNVFLEHQIRIGLRMSDLVSLGVKATLAYDKTNLRDNRKRDEIVRYILKELESIREDSINMHQWLDVSKNSKQLRGG